MLLPTVRLLFEPLRANHAAGLFESLRDPRVYEHIGEPPPATIAALAGRFTHLASGPPPHCAHQRWVNFVVRLRTDGKLIGRLQATIIDRRAEVAYLFGPDHWGRGYAAEAMSALQAHLEKNWAVEGLWATTSPHNTRSVRLLGRLGYNPSHRWPDLLSYDPGDLVFVRRQRA